MKPKVLYYKVQKFQKNSIKHLHNNFEVFILDSPVNDQEHILKQIGVLFAPMGYKFDKKKIDCCKELSIIATPTTGEHHIDTEYAISKGIHICSLKNQHDFLQNITATAELAWGLIISITRKLLIAGKNVRNYKWNGREIGEQTPKMLSEMTLGVIGLGRLGTMVANYAQAFGMKVFYYDPYIYNDNFIKCSTLSDLARKSEIVSLHLHLTDETKYLISKDFLDLMPVGSYLINTSRGGIVNENDLVIALKNGHLAGAAVDMLEGEHLSLFNLSQNSLVKYAAKNDNIIITPKIGGATIDSWEKTETYIIDMVLKQIKNK